MSHDEDYLYALRLQNELDALAENETLAEEVSAFLVYFTIINVFKRKLVK